jgi:ABC-type enterochelin transport system substrate-binding protein
MAIKLPRSLQEVVNPEFFFKFVGPIGSKGQKIMRSANNVSNAGPHVRQTFLNDVFIFLTEVGNAGHFVNTGTSSVNSEFVTALNT